MRTDAKIGFAIGGVLLAVLTVYAIVVPRHNKKATSPTSVVILPQSSDGSSSSGAPPIAAADGGASLTAPLTPAKETAPVPTGPVSPGPVVVADNAGGGGASVSGFHPIEIPKDLSKTDGQKSSKLIDGSYTPDGSTPRVARSKHADVSLLPDDSDTASATSDTLYTIKSGQTLSKIAYEVYGNSRFWVVIQRENKGLDANHLKVGAKIKLPDISNVVPGPVTVSDDEIALPMAAAETPRRSVPEVTTTDAHSYTVKSGDSLYGIAKRLLGSGRKADALYALNKDVIGPDESKLKLGMVLKLPATATAPE